MVVKGFYPSINLSQQPADERQNTPWTSDQLTAGLREREREKHPFTLELILESLVYLSCKNLCLDCGSQNTRRESTQTQKEHATALRCLSTQRSRAHSHVEWDQLFSSLFVDLPAKQRFLAWTLVCRVTQTRDGRVYRIKEDHRSGWCKREKGSEGVCSVCREQAAYATTQAHCTHKHAC